MRMSRSGPPDPANAAPWRRWLLPSAVAAVFLVLLVLPRGAAPGTELSYTRFVADVGAGNVRAVTIDPAGQVTGTLAGGIRSPPPSRPPSGVMASPVTWLPITSRSPLPRPCPPRCCRC